MIQEHAVDDFCALAQAEAAGHPESKHYRYVAPLRPDEEAMAREEECDADQTSEQRRDDLTRVLRFIVGKRDDHPTVICRRIFILCATLAPGMLTGGRWDKLPSVAQAAGEHLVDV